MARLLFEICCWTVGDGTGLIDSLDPDLELALEEEVRYCIKGVIKKLVIL